MNGKKIKIIMLRLALVFAGITIALAAGEIAMRFLLPDYLAYAGIERNFFCRYDPELGWAPLPEITAQHRQNGFSTFVSQNQYGLRGSDKVTKKRTNSSRRVLVLGDSYVWGYGVNQDEIFSNPEFHSSSLEILNFGVSGYATDQEYLLYQRNGLEFDVDEVVLAFTPYNDVIGNLEKKQYGYLKPYFTIVEGELILHQDHIHDSIGRNISNQIRFHSRLVNTLERSYRIYRDNQKYKDSGIDTSIARKRVYEDGDELSEDDLEGIKITSKIIVALREIVEQQGASFSVLFIPYKPHILDRRETNHPLVEYLSRELETNGVDYFEPYFLFLNQEKEGRKLYNRFDNHFSPSGHSLFAALFTDLAMRESIFNYYRQ